MRILESTIRQIIRETIQDAIISETRSMKRIYSQAKDPSMDQIPVIHWIDARFYESDGEDLSRITAIALKKIRGAVSSGLELSANPVYPGKEQIPNLGDWGWLGLLIQPRVVTFAGDINVNTDSVETPSGLRARFEEPGSQNLGHYSLITDPSQIFGKRQRDDIEILLVPKKILGLVFSNAVFDEQFSEPMPYTEAEALDEARKISQMTGLPLYDAFLSPI